MKQIVHYVKNSKNIIKLLAKTYTNNYIILLCFWRNKLFVLLWALKHNGMSSIAKKINNHYFLKNDSSSWS